MCVAVQVTRSALHQRNAEKRLQATDVLITAGGIILTSFCLKAIPQACLLQPLHASMLIDAGQGVALFGVVVLCCVASY